jgi:UDP-glucose 4-epimerase
MKKALVTGSEGFVGKYLVPELIDNGFQVSTLDRLPSQGGRRVERHFQLELGASDIKNELQNSKFDFVFHLAAQSSVLFSLDNPSLDLSSNISGTVALLELLPILGVEKFIYAQSGGAIYKSNGLFPITELHEVGPQSPYGLSKLTAEMYIEMLCERLNVSWVSLAFSNLYGPLKNNKKGVIFEFYNSLNQSEKVKIFGSANTRDFLYITDAISALLLSTHKGKNQRINISSAKETTLLELFHEVRTGMGISNSLPEILEPIKGENVRSVLDNSLAFDVLGWRPKINIKHGIFLSLINE